MLHKIAAIISNNAALSPAQKHSSGFRDEVGRLPAAGGQKQLSGRLFGSALKADLNT